MADLPTTYFSQSAQKHLVIAELPYPQLVNTIRAVERRLGGGPDPTLTLDALRAELAKRPPPEEGDAPSEPRSPPLRGSGRAMDRDGTREPVRADPAAPLPRAAAIGDNNPPDDADPMRERLEKEYAKLIEEIAEHELAASKLPKTVNSDEDVAAVNAWVTKSRSLYRQAEAARKGEKDIYLRRGQKIDIFFGDLKGDIAERATSIEQRNTPYLEAKAAKEQAEREAAAAAKRKAADEAAAAAEVAAAAAKKAAEEKEAALRKVQEAETTAERIAAEEEARLAGQKLQVETKAQEQATKDVASATRSAERDEKVAAGGGKHSLGRTAGGGGSATLKKVMRARVLDRAAMLATLGPLQPFLTAAAVQDALDRAAKAPTPPAVNGVEFYDETTTQVR